MVRRFPSWGISFVSRPEILILSSSSSPFFFHLPLNFFFRIADGKQSVLQTGNRRNMNAFEVFRRGKTTCTLKTLEGQENERAERETLYQKARKLKGRKRSRREERDDVLSKFQKQSFRMSTSTQPPRSIHHSNSSTF